MVEDSEADIKLAQVALKKAKLINNLHIVKDGHSAIQYLKRGRGFENSTRPDLILLDLNLPRLNGHEVLKAVREDPDLTSLPVVVLTTSDADKDIINSYRLHANCYITKPVELDKFMEVVQNIEHFWVKIVKLPPKD